MTYVLRAGLVVAISLGLVHYAPNVRGDDSNARPSGATFKLFGNAALTKDPENPTNEVLRIVNDGGTPAGAFRDLSHVRIWQLDHQLRFKRAFVAKAALRPQYRLRPHARQRGAGVAGKRRRRKITK